MELLHLSLAIALYIHLSGYQYRLQWQRLRHLFFLGAMSNPVKIEGDQKPKWSGTQESVTATYPTQDTVATAAAATTYFGDGEGALYACGNCTTQLYFKADSRLLCPNCSHITGGSSMFYKIRMEPTTYDTI